MKKLPEYYVIKRDESNPLWEKYIDWLNKTYDEDWSGNVGKYYGYDGGNKYNGTQHFDSLSKFANQVTLITLDYWNECVNSKPMEQRKIIGYKAPCELSGGNGSNVAKGDVYVKHEHNDCLYVPQITCNPYLSIPKELVETWEAVYEEEKLEVVHWYNDSITSQIDFKGKLTQEHIDKIKEVLK